MDAPIRNLTRPSVARVCVLVDLLKDMPNRIWLGMGKFGRWQRIIYENPPKSCSFCRMRGHSLDECKARPVLLNKGKEPLQDEILRTLMEPRRNQLQARVRLRKLLRV